MVNGFQFEAPPSGNKRELMVIVSGIQDIKGEMRIGLYTKENDFPDPEDVNTYRYIEVNKKEIKAVFELERNTTYAIAVHHDLNKDGKLNKNIFGKPTEPYGFSNNPNIWFRAPSFEECSFNSDNVNRIEIRI